MKRRITFIQRIDAGFDPQQVVLTSSSLSVRELDAAREDRFTVELDQLPEQLRGALEHSSGLHLRWASERPYDALAPFASRVSPGLHVQYTPLKTDESPEALCTLLRAVVGPDEDAQFKDCTKPEESFIEPPLSTNSASSASLQYHTHLPSVKNLVKYIQNDVCAKESTECHTSANALLTADSIDIDYDSSSRALTVSGFWANPPKGGWTDQIMKPSSSADQIEFGLLGAEPGLEPEEIKMGGLLAVVGQDQKLKPTMFSFPSRHQHLIESSSYTVSFTPPTGLHPEMSITIPRSTLKQPPAPNDATCALHTYLTLPSTIFGDQYQLATTDPLFLESHNLAALNAHAGEMDLEAPDWIVKKWGSSWLLELATSPTQEQDQTAVPSNWTATIPLHLRYLPPSESGYRTAHVPWPIVFWACTTDDEEGMGPNPFERTHLGWDGLFGPRTTFYQLSPAGERLVEDVDVPVLRLSGEGMFQGKFIELGTCVVISLGFLWVLLKLVRVAWSSGAGANGKSGRVGAHDKKD
ncbi:unnamed protein product [Penicillium olsonii]|nr:unnamed protein product [Penicillium olsonii]CAG7934215.1 unnamed protein product [Penicillium olsonii]